MSEHTIHSGKSRRGVILALVALAIFVGGVAILGNSTSPDATPGATVAE